MEMDRPPACKCTWVEDGKQEIYLEWPNLGNSVTPSWNTGYSPSVRTLVWAINYYKQRHLNYFIEMQNIDRKILTMKFWFVEIFPCQTFVLYGTHSFNLWQAYFSLACQAYRGQPTSKTDSSELGLPHSYFS